MIPARGYEGARVAVLGLGRSGLAAARALKAGGAEVIAWDDGAAARDGAEAEGFTLEDLTRESAWSGVALLVASPGIPHLYPAPHPAIAAAIAAGVPVDNDIGLFFRALGSAEWERFDAPPRVIAITGSNGKSTVSALVHHILQAAGKESQLGGNIGRGVFDLAPPGDGGVVVLELSSYQTELARALTPDIAVFTNLTADHLDRHGGMGGYFAAKARLFTQGGPDRAIIGVDEMEGRMLANVLAEGRGDDRVIRVSAGQKLAQSGWSVFARKGHLAEWRGGRQIASIDLRPVKGLPGAHNHQNACAAYAATRALGLAPRLIESAFETFEGLPHRSQLVAEVGGVAFVNDSKATNIASAAQALQAFEKIRWIVGGQMKDGGLDALSAHFPRIVKAYVIGRHAPETALMLGGLAHDVSGTMAEAVAGAAAEAEAGETVLLAPAGASFDQYDDFEARGADFIAEVQRVLGASAE